MQLPTITSSSNSSRCLLQQQQQRQFCLYNHPRQQHVAASRGKLFVCNVSHNRCRAAAALICRAQQQPQRGTSQQQQQQKAPAAPPSSLTGRRSSPLLSTSEAPGEEEQQRWAPFDWAAYQQPWVVPWGGATVATTMAVWIVGFAGTAFLAMPAAYGAIAGKPLWQLSPAGQADFALWSEIAECVVTFGILGSVAARYAPQVSEAGLFNFSPAEPFKKGTGWLAWGLFGLATAPLVVGSTALLLSALHYDTATSGGHGTVDGVAGMIALDGPTYARLLTVTGVLAPALEESLFRGFLLTSLTKVMPPWAAVLASSVAFGLAHLSLRDLPVLIALGCWLGALYCRSRNLLTPILVHGAWNSSVLSLLFWLTAAGFDIEKLLRDNAL